MVMLGHQMAVCLTCCSKLDAGAFSPSHFAGCYSRSMNKCLLTPSLCLSQACSPPFLPPSHLQLTCGEFLGNLVSHGHSPLWIDYGQQIGLKCLHSFYGFLVNDGGTATVSHFEYFWFQSFFKDMSNCRHVEGIQGNLEKS